MPPPRSKTKIIRREGRHWARELPAIAAVAGLLHLAWMVVRDDVGAEVAVDVVIAGAWIGWRVVHAMRPRERIATWRRPRGLDAIRRAP